MLFWRYKKQGCLSIDDSQNIQRIIKSLDLLVIDEISTVRADLLDSVDAVLRRHHRNDQSFGGVQLLMIGDLHQLSPVAKQEDWQILKQYYESVYFFSSHALDQAQLVTIELKHIFGKIGIKVNSHIKLWGHPELTSLLLKFLPP